MKYSNEEHEIVFELFPKTNQAGQTGLAALARQLRDEFHEEEQEHGKLKGLAINLEGEKRGSHEPTPRLKGE